MSDELRTIRATYAILVGTLKFPDAVGGMASATIRDLGFGDAANGVDVSTRDFAERAVRFGLKFNPADESDAEMRASSFRWAGYLQKAAVQMPGGVPIDDWTIAEVRIGPSKSETFSIAALLIAPAGSPGIRVHELPA